MDHSEYEQRKGALKLLYGHEVAIRSFAEPELAGEGVDSLQDVRRITRS